MKNGHLHLGTRTKGERRGEKDETYEETAYLSFHKNSIRLWSLAAKL
jgi:hypothetical protein